MQSAAFNHLYSSLFDILVSSGGSRIFKKGGGGHKIVDACNL